MHKIKHSANAAGETICDAIVGANILNVYVVVRFFLFIGLLLDGNNNNNAALLCTRCERVLCARLEPPIRIAITFIIICNALVLLSLCVRRVSV